MDFGSQKTTIEKTLYFFSRMIPYLLQLVMAQNRSDIVFFLFFGWAVLLYINFPSSKNPAPSSSWGLSLTWRDGKTSGSLSWLLESLLQKNKASGYINMKLSSGAHVVQQMQQPCCKQNTTRKTMLAKLRNNYTTSNTFKGIDA